MLMVASGPVPARGADGKALTLTDAAGITHTLKKRPERIVVVGNAPYMPLHLLYMFPETKNALVGYERKFKTTEEFLPLLDPGIDKKKVLEANPGPEQIAALHPDVVITKGSAVGPLDKVLSVIGIPLIHLGFEDPGTFFKDVAIVGTLLGDESRAEEIVKYYTRKLNIVRTGLEAVPTLQRPSVLLLEYSNRGGQTAVRVPARSWIQTIQATISGGRPVWTNHLNIQDGWQVVGFEQIAAWNPDKIFVVVWFRLNGVEVLHALKSDSQWRKLKAVAANQLYLFPGDVFGWDSADPRWLLGVLWLATKMHPRRFEALDMKQAVFEFYENLYGLKSAVVRSELMPRVHLDEE